MPNLLHFTYAILSLILIIFSCTFFTNAIEHLGKRLNLGNNVTGSILAVIGTTLPETVVPLVAIFGAMIVGGDISIGQEIAIGAITGSPFMLSTFALFVLGLTICFRNNKDIETNISNVLRNYKYIIFAYIIALCGAFISNGKIKIAFAIFLVLMYAFFVLRTFLNSEDENKNDELKELYITKFLGKDFKNNLFFICLQLAFSLIFLTIFSHCFVGEIKYFSAILGLNPLILSLIIAPFATELPECVNSVIWAKENKDDLAIANISGATVFQSTVLFAMGMILTSWSFEVKTLIGFILVLCCSLILFLNTLITKKLSIKTLLFCGVFYLGYIIYIFTK